MSIFFSASIHPKAGFLLGAFVYAPIDLNKHVAGVMRGEGWTPGEDEVRSGFTRWSGAAAEPLRHRLRQLLARQCRTGIVIAPADRLVNLGPEALRALAFFFQKHSFPSRVHDVFFDRGIFAHPADAGRLARGLDPLPRCRFHFEQSARRILSLQLAGLAAHTCASDLADVSGEGVSGNLLADLYISPDCTGDLRFLAEMRFGRGRLGLLH